MNKVNLIFTIILCLLPVASFAQLENDNGVSYLISSQYSTGSWGNTSGPTNNEHFATFEVLETLGKLNQTSALSYQNGILWLQAEELGNTAYVSHKIAIIANTGIDITTDINALLSCRNADGGWGGNLKYRSNNYHTALAVSSLKKISYSDLNTLGKAVGYLKSTQNPDGGWGFYQGNESNVYMTALVLNTFNVLSSTFDVKIPTEKAVAYLFAKQNPDGGFGTTTGQGQGSGQGSTTYETALAFDVLIKSGVNSEELGMKSLSAINSWVVGDGDELVNLFTNLSPFHLRGAIPFVFLISGNSPTASSTVRTKISQNL